MSVLGSNIAQSLAGISQAERLAAKPKPVRENKPGIRRREGDSFEPLVDDPEGADPTRRVAANHEEDAREDHQAQDHPESSVKPKGEGGAGERKPLDLNA